MHIKQVSEVELKSLMRNKDMGMIVYGAGVIGRVAAPEFLRESGLAKRVLFFADQDIKKQGHRITIGDIVIKVVPPEAIGAVKQPFVILITSSRYQGILEYLEQAGFRNPTYVCILPQLLADRAEHLEKQVIRKQSDISLIPKTIHYCWFGGNEMPEKMKYCIESWKKNCPQYEIIEWNEKNYDVSKYTYTRQAYQHGKWAFVSDVARLDILYQYGGIYMDTDVELLHSLDGLLYQPGFCSVEKWGIVNTGGGCGAIPGHTLIDAMIRKRRRCVFEYKDGTLNLESSGSYESLPLLKQGFVPDNKIQCVHDMTIYPSDFFHPYDYMTKKTCITENTFGIHHFAESWI